MDTRFNKFKEHKLNAAELDAFRNDVEAMSDEELDALIETMDSTSDFTDDDVDRLQHRLNTEIDPSAHKLRLYKIVGSIAAAIILALTTYGIFTTLKIRHYQQYDNVLSEDINITTSNNETITTILPDGSKVTLGPQSVLSYALSSFNNHERNVSFSGDGRFSIAKSKSAPFTVLTGEFKIEVLGTTFSVLSRDIRELAEIYLEEGSIQLTALATNITECMHPGETAVINRTDGSLTIYKEHLMPKRSVGKSMLYFESVRLSDVLNELEIYYGIGFSASAELVNETFTGAIPTDSLQKAIFILEQTLHANSYTTTGNIHIESREHRKNV